MRASGGRSIFNPFNLLDALVECAAAPQNPSPVPASIDLYSTTCAGFHLVVRLWNGNVPTLFAAVVVIDSCLVRGGHSSRLICIMRPVRPGQAQSVNAQHDVALPHSRHSPLHHVAT